MFGCVSIFADMPTILTCSKVQKNTIFWPQKRFFAILPDEAQSYHFKTTFNRFYGQKYVCMWSHRAENARNLN